MTSSFRPILFPSYLNKSCVDEQHRCCIDVYSGQGQRIYNYGDLLSLDQVRSSEGGCSLNNNIVTVPQPGLYQITASFYGTFTGDSAIYLTYLDSHTDTLFAINDEGQIVSGLFTRTILKRFKTDNTQIALTWFGSGQYEQLPTNGITNSLTISQLSK